MDWYKESQEEAMRIRSDIIEFLIDQLVDQANVKFDYPTNNATISSSIGLDTCDILSIVKLFDENNISLSNTRDFSEGLKRMLLENNIYEKMVNYSEINLYKRMDEDLKIDHNPPGIVVRIKIYGIYE